MTMFVTDDWVKQIYFISLTLVEGTKSWHTSVAPDEHTDQLRHRLADRQTDAYSMHGATAIRADGLDCGLMVRRRHLQHLIETQKCERVIMHRSLLHGRAYYSICALYSAI